MTSFRESRSFDMERGGDLFNNGFLSHVGERDLSPVRLCSDDLKDSTDVFILFLSVFLLSSGTERSEPLLVLLVPLSFTLSEDLNGDLL